MSGRIALLDHGSIELIESWGSDERIIEAARMSTNKGFLGWGPTFRCSNTGARKCGIAIEKVGDPVGRPCPMCNSPIEAVPGDEKLLRFLWENAHATPFEMAGATVEVQAPIFVFREWHRHRTQSYNELSARYTPLPDVNYIPTIGRMMSGAAPTGNKQASGMYGTNLKENYAGYWVNRLRELYALVEEHYQAGLQNGVPKELARLPVPVGRYSRMRASANLRNWLGFLTLRQAPNAQWEIRQYANALHGILAEKFPRTLSLFDEGAKT